MASAAQNGYHTQQRLITQLKKGLLYYLFFIYTKIYFIILFIYILIPHAALRQAESS